MGRLSRARLKILAVLKALPQAEAIGVKLRLRNDEQYKMDVARAFACRGLKDTILPTQAEIARAALTLEVFYTT